jgi:hypothetical protein
MYCSNACKQRAYRERKRERDARSIESAALLLESWGASLDGRGIGTANLTPELADVLAAIRATASRVRGARR